MRYHALILIYFQKVVQKVTTKDVLTSHEDPVVIGMCVFNLHLPILDVHKQLSVSVDTLSEESRTIYFLSYCNKKDSESISKV